MTKHDDDLTIRAEKPIDPHNPLPDLVERFRVLEERFEALGVENAELRRDLVKTRERLTYYQGLCAERFGFVPTAPPGVFLNEE